jgi:glycosyltransferase involved in cell wall biosynthesis
LGSWALYQRLIDSLGIRANVRTHLDYVPPDDIELYFESADVVALPYTHFDAQSTVGALALPFGKPLSVTDAAGLPELVRTPAAIVPAGSTEDLQADLLRVLKSPALRRKLAGDSARITHGLSGDGSAITTIEVYWHVVEAT